MSIKRLLTFSILIILTTALLYGKTNLSEARIDILADIESQAITFLQDKDGFIWIGTIIDGVYRFDGKTLQRYLGPDHKIAGSNIPCIFEDSKGNLWFADNGVGVHRYDKERNTITSYSHDPKNRNSISSNSFYWSGRQVIVEDKFGEIWIGAYGGGLNRLDQKTGSIKRYSMTLKIQQVLVIMEFVQFFLIQVEIYGLVQKKDLICLMTSLKHFRTTFLIKKIQIASVVKSSHQ